MARNENEPRAPFRAISLGLAAIVGLPLLLLALMFLELWLFKTRHTVDVLEALGLTEVLERIFTALGING